MHTVIILSKHSSDLLREYRYLFQPFVDKGAISFCDWNESGTDLETSVPDLYKQIRGKVDWRTVIVSAEPVYGNRKGPVPDEKNPFDFPAEAAKAAEDAVPQDSAIPLVRLTHMICGYPAAPVKNFEEAYEYVDVETGVTHRVRASELSREEFYALSEQYRDGLRPIYLQERVSEEAEKARKALEEKYTFSDVRPQEVYLFSLRRHPDDENYIYESWKSPFEMESSDFSRRNNYPGICRFICGDITNPENSRYTRELVEFWMGILTVAVNHIPASILQAYKLYRMQIEVSKEELGETLNQHLNKMEAASAFVQTRLGMKPENAFEDGARIVEKQRIPVIFTEVSGKDLYISTKDIGLSRDCPADELMYWNTSVREKSDNVERYLKMPRRAVDRAAAQVKSRAESFFDEEYELDRFQIEELEEELDTLELQILTSDTRSTVDGKQIQKKVNEIDRKVKKDIAVRMRRGVVISTGVLILLVYLMGYIPYMFNSLRNGGGAFAGALGISLGATLIVAIGGIVALVLLRKQIVASMERFNDLMRSVVNSVNTSAHKYEEYFSTLCTYMKAQSIYAGVTKRKDAVSARVQKLRTHKQALRTTIARDEELAAAFGIRRAAAFEKNVTRFFDEDKVSKDNRLYYYEIDGGKTEIPLNTAGDMIWAPYKFIAGLKIEREDLYEDVKGEES